MKHPRTLVVAAVAFIVSSPAGAACTGKDLFVRLKAEHPAFTAKVEREAAAAPFSRGKLFRLGKPGVAPSYAFGTAHVADPRATTFTPVMRRALDQSRTVVLELKESESLGNGKMAEGLDPAAMLRFSLAKVDERADRFLSPDLMARLENALPAYGLPAAAARTFSPSLLVLTLSLPPCAKDIAGPKVVDASIAQIAREGGKSIVGLETVAEQFAAVADFSPAVARELLVSTIKLIDYAEDTMEALVVLYRRSETGVLLAWAREPYPVPGVDAHIPPEFYEVLIDQRNERMAERALPLLEAGGAFIAVGAAHLPGDKGLLRLFEKAGYKVEMLE